MGRARRRRDSLTEAFGDVASDVGAHVSDSCDDGQQAHRAGLDPSFQRLLVGLQRHQAALDVISHRIFSFVGLRNSNEGRVGRHRQGNGRLAHFLRGGAAMNAMSNSCTWAARLRFAAFVIASALLTLALGYYLLTEGAI
ncbi:MAG TPA: hypothetical protein VHZ78_08795 [Rhizomicrobium sp.]|jgi:hypothetical protein|nr:hypothetical protein [Rhizomicrobium sp.]